ncbi:MAG: hypothetical protein Q8M94_19945 [Ignavibacteria bacterium]|nr:hypothetical protein [Ignavibacteria bacterium]
MINKIFLSFISAIIILLLISCNDSPTDLGTGFLGQDGVEVLKLDSSTDSIPQSSHSFKNVFSLGNSSQLLLGKAENVTAHSLIRYSFILPDSIKAELIANTLIVTDSWVELTKSYSFGDSNAPFFDYKVFKINSNWSSSSFSADSFSTLSFDNTDISSIRTPGNDTLYSFHLVPGITASWLQNYVDTTSATNYGILLSPDTLVTTQKVLGFTALNSSGINESILRIVVQKPGVYIDTLIGYDVADISVVLGESQNLGTEYLVIQSSLTSEAKLFFDLSMIPDHSDINSAVLTLTIDTLLTKTGSSFENSLRVFLLSDSSKNEVNTNYFSTLSRSGAAFKGGITNIIRAWNNNVKNEGMLIKATSELFGVEIFALKGSNAANLSDRPKLEIIYTPGSKK